MKKSKDLFLCSECGNEFRKWSGQCPECSAWNSMTEITLSETSSGLIGKPLEVKQISEIPNENISRMSSGIKELDRVLGGGIVPAGAHLIGGQPGVGKSTLLLDMVSRVAQNYNVLYVSGEETLSQLRIRAERVAPDTTASFAVGSQVEDIVASLDRMKPDVVIIDSIQTLHSSRLSAGPGSVSQIRETTLILIEHAKKNSIALFIVGHVTKDGEIAGPKLLEHMVDVVLYLEGSEENSIRILRSLKNRYGESSEIGIFAMDEKGLLEMRSPESMFIEDTPSNPGAVRTMTIEGNRAIPIEVQALSLETNFGYPKRTTNGIPLSKLQLLIAVIQKNAHIPLGGYDIYASIVGGYQAKDPSLDLALSLAVVSSFLEIPFPKEVLALGEVSLSGAILPPQNFKKRLKEAEILGYQEVLVSHSLYDIIKGSELSLVITPVKHISQAISYLKKQNKHDTK